jgi:phospholipid/cholesterol/gamma-HCH transport system substrate-binding protein
MPSGDLKEPEVKRSMDLRWAELWVGLLLVSALVLLGLGLFMVGEKTRLFARTATIQARLPNVQGLKAGAPVWLSGVVIGTVADVAFADPLRSDQVTVALEIDEEAARRLGPDAVVTVKTRGLVGEKYVDITPGTRFGVAPTAPLQGEAPVGLDEVIEDAHRSFQRFDRLVGSLEGSEGSLQKLVADPTLYDNLVQLTARLQQLLAAMTEGEGSLARIINDPQLYREMVAFSAQGKEAASQVQAFVTSLNDPQGTFFQLAHDPALYQESVQAMAQARKSMAELDALLAALREGQGTAGKLVSETELHDQLLKTLKDLDALARDLKENPGRYVRFSLF